MLCPLCGGDGGAHPDHPLGVPRPCSWYHAPVLLSWQWPSEAEYERFYVEDARYHEQAQRDEGQRSFWQRDSDHLGAAAARLRMIQAASGPIETKGLLDIGAGTGIFASLARSGFAMDAEGLEPNPGMVAQGQSLGRPVLRGDWREARAGDAWDFITLFDVFEHLSRPRACLRHLRDCLAPEGLLIFEMPEYQAPDPAWKKHIRPKQHLCLYSREAAEQLYREEGFEIVLFYRPLNGILGKMSHFLRRRDDA